MALRRKPSIIGSVTATICITPDSIEALHPLADRGLGEADLRAPSFVYGSRPSSWSASTMALSTSSMTTGVLRSGGSRSRRGMAAPSPV